MTEPDTPLDELTTRGLIAVLDNDTGTYPGAGSQLVPAAIEELRRRAQDGDKDARAAIEERFDERLDAKAIEEENSVGTTLLAARGFNGLIALCRELVGGVQQIGSPVELEEAIEYARDAKARAIVGNADREVLDKIDVDVVALEVALEARRTILELAERLEARANLTL